MEELSQRIRDLESEKVQLLSDIDRLAEESEILRQEHDATIDAYKEVYPHYSKDGNQILILVLL